MRAHGLHAAILGRRLRRGLPTRGAVRATTGKQDQHGWPQHASPGSHALGAAAASATPDGRRPSTPDGRRPDGRRPAVQQLMDGAVLDLI